MTQGPAPDVKTFVTSDFRLQSGLVMPPVTIAYRTLAFWRRIATMLVLVTHGNTSGPQMIDARRIGRRRQLERARRPRQGGRYRPLLSSICPNMLGSSYGSTNAASIDPATGKRYGSRFPDITVSDIVATQRALLDHLGIDRLVAIVGPSYGGFQALQWAVDYPGMMRGIAAVVTAPLVPRERSEGNVERLLSTLSKDPNWNGGDYYDRGGVLETMIQIRMATLKTYGIETRLRDTMSDPAEIEAAIRDEADAMGGGLRCQLADHSGEGAARFRRDGADSPASSRKCCMSCRGPTGCFRRNSRPA